MRLLQRLRLDGNLRVDHGALRILAIAAAIMEGEIPAVLINGMGKANPTAEEVAAEYERTIRGK